MKSLLASLLLVSSFATADNGGDGLSRPDDYYNPDYKCSINSNVTLYVKARPGKEMEVSATTWDQRTNKVSTVYLDSRFAYEGHQSGVYSVEALNGSPVAFLEVNYAAYKMTALDANNNVVSHCQFLSTPIDGGPYYP